MDQDRASLAPWLGGILIGVALCAAFWAGHQFWPGQKVPLPISQQTALPLPLAPPQGIALGEHTIAEIADQASASVVNIDTSSSITIPDSPFHFGPLREFEFFFGPNAAPFPHGERKFERRGAGSGVIIRQEGYILTNNHVVGQADSIQVTLNDKRVFKGKVVGRDRYTDLALVKIDTSGLKAARFGSSKNLRPGDWVIAIGSPLGLDHSVTLGIVSALNRSLSDIGNVELIQTDAAINPGNSGGPLLNIHGEVIGLNTAIRGDAQNIGFAIPVDVAKEVTDQLLAHGKISRSYLGIYMQDLDEKLAKSLGAPANTKGVVIARVAPNGPAEKSGLAQGDVIEKIDGKSVATSKEVQTLIRKQKPGDTLNFLILRGGELKGLPVKIGDYPAAE